MIPALAQVCTLPADFAEEIGDYAAGGCRAIEFWLTKLEQFIQANSIERVDRLLEENQVTPVAASFHGGLFQPENLGFDDAWSTFRARLELCSRLNIPTLVVAGDVKERLTQELVDRVTARLSLIATAAAESGVRVALEFQAAATFPNNLQSAIAVCESVGNESLGLCLDAFHFHTGPSKLADLAGLTRANLYHVQVCNLANRARELATDQDRILPDEGGDIDVLDVLGRLQTIGYDKGVSVECFNPQFWQIPARQFGEIATTALGGAIARAVSL